MGRHLGTVVRGVAADNLDLPRDWQLLEFAEVLYGAEIHRTAGAGDGQVGYLAILLPIDAFLFGCFPVQKEYFRRPVKRVGEFDQTHAPAFRRQFRRRDLTEKRHGGGRPGLPGIPRIEQNTELRPLAPALGWFRIEPIVKALLTAPRRVAPTAHQATLQISKLKP